MWLCYSRFYLFVLINFDFKSVSGYVRLFCLNNQASRLCCSMLNSYRANKYSFSNQIVFQRTSKQHFRVVLQIPYLGIHIGVSRLKLRYRREGYSVWVFPSKLFYNFVRIILRSTSAFLFEGVSIRIKKIVGALVAELSVNISNRFSPVFMIFI